MPTEKLALDLAVQYAATEDDLEAWRRSFERASEILFYATDGQLQFGDLFVKVDAADDTDADAFLKEDPGRSSAKFGHHMDICHDEQINPLVIVHEFGHFFFDLRDEYPTGILTMAKCLGDKHSHACIMEWSDEGDVLTNIGIDEGLVREFCGDADPIKHKPGNAQHIQHQKSCWETIQDVRPSFVIPSPNRPYSTDTPNGHDPISWQVELDEARYILVLENSAFAGNPEFERGLKSGAKFWVDMVRITRDWFGIVGGDGQILFPLKVLEFESDIEQAISAIDGISFASQPNVSAALATALQQITPNNELARKQSTVLVSSTNPLAPPPGPTDGPDLRSKDTNVFAIDVGPNAFRDELLEIAQTTKGDLFGIDDELKNKSTGFQLLTRLADLACDLRTGAGCVFRRMTTIPGIPKADIAQNSDETASNESARHTEFVHFDRVLIEEGSEQATFVLVNDDEDGVSFDILDPRGRVVKPDGRVQLVKRDSYSLCLIDDPTPGGWTMRVRYRRANRQVTFWSAAYSRNPHLFVKVVIRQTAPESFQISATASLNGTLSNIEYPVVEVIASPHVAAVADPADVQTVLLKPRRFFDEATGSWVILKKGLYEGEVRCGQRGLYTVNVKFVNAGTAVPVVGCCDEEDEETETLAPFVRTVSKQVKL